MKTLKHIIREELDKYLSGEWIDDLEMDPLSWLRINFPDLTIGPGNKHFDKIWYAGETPVMGRVYIDKLIWVSYEDIWRKLESEFSLNYGEIRDLIRGWLEEDYKLKGFTPTTSDVLDNIRWKQITN
jgi:hypothetical protein